MICHCGLPAGYEVEVLSGRDAQGAVTDQSMQSVWAGGLNNDSDHPITEIAVPARAATSLWSLTATAARDSRNRREWSGY
jgi:hypothetical protein